MLIKTLPSRKVTAQRFEEIFSSISNLDKDRAILWYPTANKELQSLASQFGKPLPIVAGMTARLSPSITWERNLIAVRDLLEGKQIVDGYTRNSNIAINIMNGKWWDSEISVSFSFPRTSPKTFCFYHNLLHPYESSHITIDRWMIRASLPEGDIRLQEADVKVNRNNYAELSQRVIDFALSKDIYPVAMQAILWTQIRQSYKVKAPA
jgi:hypothetical protein